MITRLNIRKDGDPILRKISTPVDSIGPGERMMLAAMFQTMYKAEGVGLAAPQVGVNRCFFVLDVGHGPMAMFNPHILEKKGSFEFEEGCLSVPEKTVKITRAEKIRLKYQDETGRIWTKWFEGLIARVIQHEHDHLEGKLIIDYIIV